jgi:hypothetical protein
MHSAQGQTTVNVTLLQTRTPLLHIDSSPLLPNSLLWQFRSSRLKHVLGSYVPLDSMQAMPSPPVSGPTPGAGASPGRTAAAV